MFKMMGESKDREMIKERVKKWMSTSSVYNGRDALDMAILETFFYVYYGLENGMNIQELGIELGVFPIP